MRPLSATDAISPAWQHTSRLLWTPRNWRLLLKIGFVAFVARMGGCGSSFNTPLNHADSGVHQMPHNLWPIVAAMLAMAVVIGAVVLVIALLVFYLSSRMQFVFMEAVLRSDTTIGPIWKRYGPATWRWMGLKLLLCLCLLVLFAPFLIPVVITFAHSMGGVHGGTLQNPGAFFMAILGFIGAIFLFLLLSGIVFSLVSDFGLPSMALESTPISVTLQRVWSLVRNEPGQVSLYLLLKFVLGIACSLVFYIGFVFFLLFALIPFGIVAGVDWFSLHNMPLWGHVVMIGLWVVLGVLYVALVFGGAIMGTGYIATFMQAYALYFLGGRYPMVGQYLAAYWPPEYNYAPPPAYYPPPPPPVVEPTPDPGTNL